VKKCEQVLYEQYAKELPEETRLIISSLDNSIRQAILVLLEQTEKLSFSTIKERLGLDKLTLNYHLKKLYSSGLIDHYFEHKLGNKEYSYYSITKLGERFLNGLIMLLIPEVPFEKAVREETMAKTYETFQRHVEPCKTLYLESGVKVSIPVTAPTCSITGRARSNLKDKYASSTSGTKYTKLR